MEDQQVPPATQQPVEQQVTSKMPATKQKNPKHVAAGKAIAERTRIACEAQKKALIKAQSIIANNQPKPADPPAPVADTPSAEPETTKKVLTTTQWLSIISIVVSLAGVYYKREEIKNVLTKKADPPLPRAPPPSPVLPRAPTVDVAPKRSIRKMDLTFLHNDIPCQNSTLLKLPLNSSPSVGYS